MLSRRRAKADGGFTLIELLVVIIIIGILAAIAIPVFLNQRQKARDASAKSDISGLALLMESYRVDHPSYPTSGQLDAASMTPKTSPGTFVVIISNTTGIEGFCLAVTNTAGTPSIGAPFFGTVIYWWASNDGGLRKEADGCPGYPNAQNAAIADYWPK